VYLTPLKHKAIGLLGLGLGRKEIGRVAAREWVLSPAKRESSPPAIYVRQDLERVTGTSEHSSLEYELRSLTEDEAFHDATTAYLVRNAEIVDGHAYCGRWKDRFLSTKAPVFANRPSVTLPFGSLACTWHGNTWFGHWLLDDTTMFLAGETTGSPFILERPRYQHEAGYRSLLQIPAVCMARARFRELVVFDDGGQNDFKAARYRQLRERLRRQPDARGSDNVYISRGATGRRRSLINEQEIELYLKSQGFSVIHPEQLSAHQIASELGNARIVIGIEGSHMAHALLAMAEDGVVCCLQPPNRFVSIYRGYANCVGMRYATVIGRAAPDGFLIALEDLKIILDRIDSVARPVRISVP
jgi:hypothetical protein